MAGCCGGAGTHWFCAGTGRRTAGGGTRRIISVVRPRVARVITHKDMLRFRAQPHGTRAQCLWFRTVGPSGRKCSPEYAGNCVSSLYHRNCLFLRKNPLHLCKINMKPPGSVLFFVRMHRKATRRTGSGRLKIISRVLHRKEILPLLRAVRARVRSTVRACARASADRS